MASSFPALTRKPILTLNHNGTAVVVPAQALDRSGDQATVMVVNPDNHIEKRTVTLGIQMPDYVGSSASGVSKPGELVVVSDRSALKAGETVKPKVLQHPSLMAPSRATVKGNYFMSAFSIRNPYFIIVLCLAVSVLGVVAWVGMPVDLFPPINLPQVVVATFYSGMPPQDIEANITAPLERFFTLASGIDHMESHSILGVSMIRVFFQPNTSADADVTRIIEPRPRRSGKRSPPGTLPPVVLKSDASSLPVCLVAVSGAGLTETQLHDYAQFAIRNQIVTVPGVSIPATFGGKYRQIMVRVDPYKLLSRDLSVMDVVRAVNDQNLILPAGDVKMGPFDQYLYSNSLVDNMAQLNDIPLKTSGDSWVRVSDIGKAEDSNATQYNIVRVAGQKSSYVPILKQGGDTNTIQVVDGVQKLLGHLYDIPKQMKADLLFDQSVFVKEAINTVLHESLIGLALTSIMILLFLGNMRATTAVLLSIPISILATFVMLKLGNATINTMILGGLALALSRVIDNSVISIENIYRHLEMGEAPAVAAQNGASEVTLAVLAGTLVAVVDFFPVTLLFGVSKFLFSALALSFCISLVLSFVVAMTVGFRCSARGSESRSAWTRARRRSRCGNRSRLTEYRAKLSPGARFNAAFNRGFNRVAQCL